MTLSSKSPQSGHSAAGKRVRVGHTVAAHRSLLGVAAALVGAVVGATYPEQLRELRSALPHTFFLVPGYGAQGGGAKDVAPAFDANGRGAIVNASRSILCAWQKQHAPEHDYAKAAAAEAVRMRDEIVGEIGTIK